MRTDLKQFYHPIMNPPDPNGQDLRDIVAYLQQCGLPATAMVAIQNEVVDFPGGHYGNTNLVFAREGRPALSQPLYLAMNNPEAALMLLGDYYGFHVLSPPPLFHPPAASWKAPAPKVAPKVLVGGKILGVMYHGVSGDDSPAGTEYSDERGSFKKVITPNPFGQEMHWDKIG